MTNACAFIVANNIPNTKSTLMKHAVIHTQTKIMGKKVKAKISGILCGKEYTSISSLTKHEQIVKPELLQCEFCKYESNRKSSIEM